MHKNLAYFTLTDDTIFHCDNASGVFSDAGYYPSVIEAVKDTRAAHGLSKPVDGLVRILSGFRFDSLVDLFLGGGSTLIACEKTGKSCYGMELDPLYCDVIITRWQEFTGKQATHEATGKTFSELKGAHSGN